MEQLEKRFQVSRWMAEDFAGVINEEDKERLASWRRESEDNEQEYQTLWEDFLKGEELSARDMDKVRREWDKFFALHVSKRRVFRKWMGYAAAAVLVVGLAGMARWKLQPPVCKDAVGNVYIAKGDVVLVLSDGRRVPIGLDSIQKVGEETTVAINMADRTIRYQEEHGGGQEEVYNTLIVPRGGEYTIVLADGSRVWLNSQTELCYPVHFNGDCRKVYLKGEAYFEVAKNAAKPFIVETTGGIDVKVLGTRFNIASYEEDADVITTLAEGSVEVCTNGKTLRIKPDEQVLFNKNSHSFECRQVDAKNYLAWKDGLFLFEEQTMEQIMKQLQRWYEVDVFYSCAEVKNYRFSGNLRKYDDFMKIVKMLEEVAGLQISIQNKCVVIGTK